ncbi:MaoC/PaaZ C-terminal domain-containing protein [Nocardia brevicatena]|uniref:MaoC/PaaZ C-terminal domain-containing protein n=1 Tax=Nocardia brevicatena TaxID=37327 RepID=UPI0002FD71A8|nr:MaoC/PaaZ C-terminal domain-containing protein [Nocardia brevicatena]
MTAPGRISLGDRPEERTFGPITMTDIVRYAGASGDFNPLHHDVTAARAAGFAGPFSMGMLQAALLATFATDWLGAVNIRRYKTRFIEQVWPGDVLVCTGEVTDVHDAGTGIQVRVRLECRRHAGGIAVSGEADFRLPDTYESAGRAAEEKLG